jgi:hypothetical protein
VDHTLQIVLEDQGGDFLEASCLFETGTTSARLDRIHGSQIDADTVVQRTIALEVEMSRCAPAAVLSDHRPVPMITEQIAADKRVRRGIDAQ